MDETVLHGVLKYLSGVATVARSTSLAVDNHLSIKADRSLSAEVIHDIEAISESGSRGLSPAGSTVLGDVLILVPGHVVSSILVSPVK